MSTILRALEPLASTRALDLVVGLYGSGVLLLLSPDDRLIIPFFLLQRAIVIVLVWPNIGLPLVKVSAAASVGVGLIYLATVWSLHHRSARAVARARQRTQPLVNLPVRALAVALALLLAHGVVQKYAPALLPPLVTQSVAWLFIEFGFAVLIAPTALHTGFGVLAFADGGRILYAITRPDALAWGLWAWCDVLVALAAAHLRTVEIAAYAPRHLSRQVRQEPIEIPTTQGEMPPAGAESHPLEHIGENAATRREQPVRSAFSAGPAVDEPSGDAKPPSEETP